MHTLVSALLFVNHIFHKTQPLGVSVFSKSVIFKVPYLTTPVNFLPYVKTASVMLTSAATGSHLRVAGIIYMYLV